MVDCNGQFLYIIYSNVRRMFRCTSIHCWTFLEPETTCCEISKLPLPSGYVKIAIENGDL